MWGPQRGASRARADARTLRESRARWGAGEGSVVRLSVAPAEIRSRVLHPNSGDRFARAG